MDKNQNKVEKLENDLELDKAPGGFVGGDWNKKSAHIYESLGIKQDRDLLKKDTCYIGTCKVPKDYVYTLAHIWKNDGEEEAKGFVKAILELEENGYLDGEAKERLNDFFERVYNDKK